MCLNMLVYTVQYFAKSPDLTECLNMLVYTVQYFAKSPDLTTLLTADPKFQDVIGRAVVPADSDAEAVNLMYGCAGEGFLYICVCVCVCVCVFVCVCVRVCVGVCV